MLKLLLGVATLGVLMNSALADPSHEARLDHSNRPMLLQATHISTVSVSSRAPDKEPVKRAPIDEAALLLANLVGDAPQPTSGSGGVSDLRVRPWFNGRNGVGVKVELSW